MDSLAKRRELACVTFLYRILNFSIDCPDLLSQMNLAVPRLSSRGSATFYCPAARINLMMKSPIYRMFNHLNRLGDTIDINFCSINDLQRAIMRT